MKTPGFFRLFLFAGTLGFFLSCGVEDYAYLKPVPSGSIQVSLNNKATVPLPGQDSGSNFTHYNLYYRIYISDIQEAGEIQKSREAMNRINPALASDYFALEPYTNVNNNVNTSTASLFRNRSYQVLSYEWGGAELNNVVNDGAGSLVLDFPEPTGSIPFLTYNGGNPYNLYRSNGNGAFSPLPDRYFQNSQDINSGANAINTINADVVNKSSASGSYTYAALYIAAEGLSHPSYTPFYSIPTFIGVFRLPERN
jgi:hypothetical protein